MEKSDKATVYRNGSTEQYMKDIGTTIKQKDGELSGMLKAIYTLVNLKLIKLTDMEHTHMLTEADMKVNG